MSQRALAKSHPEIWGPDWLSQVLCPHNTPLRPWMLTPKPEVSTRFRSQLCSSRLDQVSLNLGNFPSDLRRSDLRGGLSVKLMPTLLCTFLKFQLVCRHLVHLLFLRRDISVLKVLLMW